jgi:hypothetical protein
VALPSQLILNGIGYNTIRGSVSEQRGTGVVWNQPRVWSATLDIDPNDATLSANQLANLVYCFQGVPVAMTTPKGEVFPSVVVVAQGVPGVIPRRPLQVQVTVTEIIT